MANNNTKDLIKILQLSVIYELPQIPPKKKAINWDVVKLTGKYQSLTER